MTIRDLKRDNIHYYIEFTPDVGNPQFKNERQYNNIQPDPDTGYRLLSLYRYWNVIQYFSPYKNLLEENWNDVLTEFLPKFIKATDEIWIIN